MIYFDTSALAKKYVAEAGSDLINRIIADAVSIATSKITYPEMLSAFVRRNKMGDVSDKELSELINEFENNWNYFFILDIKDDLFKILKIAIKKHHLKVADAVHLASALWLRDNIAGNVSFSASDMNLLRAAELEGLKVINPME